MRSLKSNLLVAVLSALQIRKMETSQKFLEAERGEGSCMVTMMTMACSINGESINADSVRI